MLTGDEPFAEFERVKDVIAACTRTKTKAELLQAAARARPADRARRDDATRCVANAQLAARDYWQTVEHPELGRSVRYPGPFARFSATPIRYRRRPPTVGEHNARDLRRRARLQRRAARGAARRGGAVMADQTPRSPTSRCSISCG